MSFNLPIVFPEYRTGFECMAVKQKGRILLKTKYLVRAYYQHPASALVQMKNESMPRPLQ